jgi:hypothetical protein
LVGKGCEETVLRKQLFVHIKLNKLGRVLILEQGIFGASNQFLAVVEQRQDSDLNELGPELLASQPNGLTEHYSPRYMVDSLGFYNVSGKFPPYITSDEKGQFAKEMVELGAVGFRREGEEGRGGFSLQFVHSSSLDHVTGCDKFDQFDLAIQSGEWR